MNVLLLGASGQLGTALQKTRPEGVNLIACRRADIDLAACEDVERLVAANSVQLIVNAAAYTAVDKAETEEALAFRVNAQSVASVARAAQRMGARFVHVSTDYVFDGTKGAPYLPDDPIGAAHDLTDGPQYALIQQYRSQNIPTIVAIDGFDYDTI